MLILACPSHSARRAVPFQPSFSLREHPGGQMEEVLSKKAEKTAPSDVPSSPHGAYRLHEWGISFVVLSGSPRKSSFQGSLFST